MVIMRMGMIMTKIDEFFEIIDDNKDGKGVRYIKA